MEVSEKNGGTLVIIQLLDWDFPWNTPTNDKGDTSMTRETLVAMSKSSDIAPCELHILKASQISPIEKWKHSHMWCYFIFFVFGLIHVTGLIYRIHWCDWVHMYIYIYIQIYLSIYLSIYISIHILCSKVFSLGLTGDGIKMAKTTWPRPGGTRE